MKPELKTQWVEALRSGKFIQGRGVLKREGVGTTYYCCLGVLREIVDPGSCDSQMDSGYYLSDSFLCQVHLSFDDQSLLAMKNDGDDDFEEIADYIERKL